MKNVLWLIAGFVAGFVVAQRVGKTEAGKAFFDDVESRIHDFGDNVVDGYRSREAELRSMLADFSDNDGFTPDGFSDDEHSDDDDSDDDQSAADTEAERLSATKSTAPTT